jgi:hypothetical protein
LRAGRTGRFVARPVLAVGRAAERDDSAAGAANGKEAGAGAALSSAAAAAAAGALPTVWRRCHRVGRSAAGARFHSSSTSDKRDTDDGAACAGGARAGVLAATASVRRLLNSASTRARKPAAEDPPRNMCGSTARNASRSSSIVTLPSTRSALSSFARSTRRSSRSNWRRPRILLLPDTPRIAELEREGRLTIDTKTVHFDLQRKTGLRVGTASYQGRRCTQRASEMGVRVDVCTPLRAAKRNE